MSKKRSNMSAGIGEYAARQHMEPAAKGETKAQAGYLICTQCLASHHEKHWYTQDETLKRGWMKGTIETLCPGCFRIANNICEGTVEIEGPIDPSKRAEITAMIANVENDCWQDNPSSRILSTSEQVDKVVIKTTSTWLAKRIGKQLEKTFKGHLQIKDSPDKGTVFVRWSQ